MPHALAPRPAFSPSPVLIWGPLAGCALIVALVIRHEAGAEGFASGVGLALLPLPFIALIFARLDAVAPKPTRALLFAFVWGACAATFLALVMNGVLLRWITGASDTVTPAHDDMLRIVLLAPVVEEVGKGAVVLLLFLYRPVVFHGVLAGLVTAGLSATGFAFTENVLYLGSAVTQDRMAGTAGMINSTAVVTFVVRILVAPFAHPVFTALTGAAIGLAATLPPEARRWRRGLPVLGLAAAIALHSVWNASTALSFFGFAAVYVLVMLPVFALLSRWALRERRRQLRSVRRTLPVYTEAGWLSDGEPDALGSLQARGASRRLARRRHGAAGARAVADYQAAATSLALLRERADQGVAGDDFPAHERDLLARMWRHRDVAAATILSAARSAGRRSAGRAPAPTAAPPRAAAPAGRTRPDRRAR
ncbi:PrsW family intramembrane metalloprotease [Streptomyces avicenniae]|uniref:PrsW family intramembrane metalloprotease n=1 Tax=Streptomyces avicenniae TaxID=500153 RepID=UPI0006995CB9|nr:PrsW family intramembrane metalloprotease [Streptomyces avicenniae]